AEELEQRRLARAARADERDDLAGFDRQVDPIERRHGRLAAAERPRHALHLVEQLAHSTCLSASAGRRRAARSAPAAPAISPPASTSAKPSSGSEIPSGAVSETFVVAVRAST